MSRRKLRFRQQKLLGSPQEGKPERAIVRIADNCPGIPVEIQPTTVKRYTSEQSTA